MRTSEDCGVGGGVFGGWGAAHRWRRVQPDFTLTASESEPAYQGLQGLGHNRSAPEAALAKHSQPPGELSV
ncbi:MAG: hypothetical protein KME26_30485 [Oscillatoria princeps RMCB-10]|nr:hypothetical protein [Oscillatoria princeps RMCB-10]